MTLDKAEQIAKLIKEIMLIVALVIGGIWAYYRFVVLESASAKIAYEKALANSKAFGMQVAIEASSFAEHGCKVFGTVSLQNLGSEQVEIDLATSPPVSVSPIAIDRAGHFTKKKSTRHYWIDDTDAQPRPKAVVVPGRTVTLPFAFDAEKPGLYLMRFAAPITFARSSDRAIVNRWSERKIFRACAPADGRSVQTVRR